jgi:cytoskeletal protein CcmA (bactofilin family)
MKTRILLTCFLAFSFAFHAYALRIETGNDIRITEPVHEDLYVFGSAIYIDAPVYGDIWCAGGTVTVNDTIHGDLVAAGGNIYLRGAVLDDVRAAGGTLMISGVIVGDLLIAGGTVTVEPSANIGGDVAMSGGTVTLGSAVQGSVQVTGGKVFLNGSVGKELEFNGGELTLNGIVAGPSKIAATKLMVGERAALRGNVRYWTDKGEVDFKNALQNGAVLNFDPSLRVHYERPDAKFLGFASFMAVLWYLIASFILIWLGQWLFAKTFKKAAETAHGEPVRSLGFGFVYFAAVPVGIVLLFITLVGIPVGVIALVFYGMLFALANIITALVGANWIQARKNYQWRSIQIVGVALGLLVALKIVFAIPFVGWIFHVAIVLIAFGAILENTGIFRRTPANIQSV